MAVIVHPGAPVPVRMEAVATALHPITGTLQPGETVMAEVARLFTEAGCKGGVLFLQGGRCEPFRYVLPALATDGEHAAWYSDTLAPPSGTILAATAIVGLHGDEPFLHCHGLWDTGEAEPRMGHLLPFESRIAAPIAVRGYGSPTAVFDRIADLETNFTLFSAAGESVPGQRNLLLRVRPNEDIATAIETACAAGGIAEAHLHGIGSIAEVAYDDGRSVPCIATEIVIERGRLVRSAEGPRAELDVAVVDVAGDVTRGRLLRGANPVGVTFELVIVGQDKEEGR